MVIEGNLRAWHKPIGGVCPEFYVPVENPQEAVKIIRILLEYDSFLDREKLLYKRLLDRNLSGLEIFTEGDWHTWFSSEGEDFNEYAEAQTDQN